MSRKTASRTAPNRAMARWARSFRRSVWMQTRWTFSTSKACRRSRYFDSVLTGVLQRAVSSHVPSDLDRMVLPFDVEVPGHAHRTVVGGKDGGEGEVCAPFLPLENERDEFLHVVERSSRGRSTSASRSRGRGPPREGRSRDRERGGRAGSTGPSASPRYGNSPSATDAIETCRRITPTTRNRPSGTVVYRSVARQPVEVK